jgi:hypothetical protein
MGCVTIKRVIGIGMMGACIALTGCAAFEEGYEASQHHMTVSEYRQYKQQARLEAAANSMPWYGMSPPFGVVDYDSLPLSQWHQGETYNSLSECKADLNMLFQVVMQYPLPPHY